MLIIVAGLCLAATLSVLNALFTTALIGKPRKPFTPSVAVCTIILSALLVTVYVAAALRLLH